MRIALRIQDRCLNSKPVSSQYAWGIKKKYPSIHYATTEQKCIILLQRGGDIIFLVREFQVSLRTM